MPAKKSAAENGEAPKKPAARRRRKVTHEMIELRAYELSQTAAGASPLDNWLAAERELTGA